MDALTNASYPNYDSIFESSRQVEGPSFAVNFETGYDTVTKVLMDTKDESNFRISFTQEMVCFIIVLFYVLFPYSFNYSSKIVINYIIFILF